MAISITHETLAKILGPDTGYAADLTQIAEDVRTGAAPGWPMARLELVVNRLTNLAATIAEGGTHITEPITTRKDTT